MEIYTEKITIKISKIQKQTLEKLKVRNVRVSDFIRKLFFLNYILYICLSEVTVRYKKKLI